MDIVKKGMRCIIYSLERGDDCNDKLAADCVEKDGVAECIDGHDDNGVERIDTVPLHSMINESVVSSTGIVPLNMESKSLSDYKSEIERLNLKHKFQNFSELHILTGSWQHIVSAKRDDTQLYFVEAPSNGFSVEDLCKFVSLDFFSKEEGKFVTLFINKVTGPMLVDGVNIRTGVRSVSDGNSSLSDWFEDITKDRRYFFHMRGIGVGKIRNEANGCRELCYPPEVQHNHPITVSTCECDEGLINFAIHPFETIV